MINPAYSLLLVVSGLISLFIAGVVWLRRPLAGASHLAVVMMSMTVWSLAYAFSWLVPDERGKFFWVGIAFFGVAVSSPSFLAMAFEFTGRQDQINWKFYVYSYTVPLIAMVFYWTDPWFGLFFGGANFKSGRPAARWTGSDDDRCEWVHLYYLGRRSSDTLLEACASFEALLGHLYFDRHVLPGIWYLYQHPAFQSIPGLDLTPIAFTMSGMFYAYGLFTYRILNVAPVRRRKAILKHGRLHAGRG